MRRVMRLLDALTVRRRVGVNLQISTTEYGVSRSLMRMFGQTPPPLRAETEEDDPRMGYVMRIMEANEDVDG